VKRLARTKTSTAKLAKNKAKFEVLRQQTVSAKTAMHKRDDTTYREGMNMDDPFAEIIIAIADDDAMAKKSAAKKRKEASGIIL
jgi:hypothetical protein